MDIKRCNSAFTLAEVLITLGIIGIVAALTIPGLLANYEKQMYVTRLKKAYAEVVQALNVMAADKGCQGDLACTGVFNYTDAGGQVEADNRVGNELKKYLKVVKDCGTNYTEGDSNTTCLAESFSIFYDGSGTRVNMNTNYAGSYNFITADGFSVCIMLFNTDNTDCKANWNPAAKNQNINQSCGEMMIDVNGLQGPNNLGRDVFDFYITNGKGPALYPNGGSEFLFNDSAWKDASGNPKDCADPLHIGSPCAGRVLEQGWQMLY